MGRLRFRILIGALSGVLPGVLALTAPAAQAQAPAETPPPPRANAEPRPMDPAARERFDQGSAHYNLGEYDEAIFEFKAAYRIEPRPQFLWSIAQSQRLKGDFAAAIRSYESFLRAGPTPAGAARAWEQIAVCQAKIAAASAPVATPPTGGAPADAPPSAPARRAAAGPAPATLAIAPAPKADVAPAPNRWHDRIGHALLWTGVAGLAAGGTMLVVGNRRMAAAGARSTYDGYLSARDGARTWQVAGVAAIVVGGALAVGGAIRFIYLPGGGSLSLGGAF
jgi:hypothetical protein